MEYLQLFDKNKNMINEKIDRELKKSLVDDKYFMLVMIFIENNDGKFLLQKTSESRGSVIATTGGHVSYGDDGFNTTIKEVKEELGITLLPSDIQYVDTITWGNCFIEVYYSDREINEKDIKLQEEEVDSVDWYTIEQINKLIEEGIFRKGNIETFHKILNYKKKILYNNFKK